MDTPGWCCRIRCRGFRSGSRGSATRCASRAPHTNGGGSARLPVPPGVYPGSHRSPNRKGRGATAVSLAAEREPSPARPLVIDLRRRGGGEFHGVRNEVIPPLRARLASRTLGGVAVLI